MDYALNFRMGLVWYHMVCVFVLRPKSSSCVCISYRTEFLFALERLRQADYTYVGTVRLYDKVDSGENLLDSERLRGLSPSPSVFYNRLVRAKGQDKTKCFCL